MWPIGMTMNSKQCLKYGHPPNKAHSLVMETEFLLIEEFDNYILM